MYDTRIAERVRQCYEAAIESGLGEKAAIDAALVLWRAARPGEAMEPSRQSVAEIIARSRVEKRAGPARTAPATPGKEGTQTKPHRR